MAKRYWLMKTEPDVFSIDDLQKKQRSLWDGVRNYQARNFMKEMSLGDEVLFYHSSCEIPGVAGVAQVSALAQPDPSQFDKKSEYFEPAATPDKPRWFCVEVSFGRKLKQVVPLTVLKAQKPLKKMILLRPGNRLSVFPVEEAEFQYILNMKI